MITTPRAEDAAAAANTFLETERGAGLDGDFAAYALHDRILSVKETAEALLTGVPYPGRDGMYVPLSSHNASRFAEAVSALPGHIVLVPAAFANDTASDFYPAVISEDGIKNNTLRLHVFKQPYHGSLSYGAQLTLSAAGQSETKGIGDHGRRASDGVEAEHFATLLTAAADTAVRAAWTSGEHINHQWRGQRNSSVTSRFTEKLLGQDVPQTTITITQEQIADGSRFLLWHEGLRGQDGRPETATKEHALVIMQGLGYQAAREQNPRSLDAVKELLA